MKTIKAIIFGALITVATIATIVMVCLLCVVDTTDMWSLIKVALIDNIALWGSVFAIKALYERWYKK